MNVKTSEAEFRACGQTSAATFRACGPKLGLSPLSPLKRMRFLSFLLLGMLLFALAEVNEAQAAAPILQVQGAIANVTSGNLTVTLPAHATDDILILGVEAWVPNTALSAVDIPTPSNWTKLGSVQQPVGTADGWIAYFWLRATSNAMVNPVVTAGAGWDTGNDTSFAGRAYTISGAIPTGNPYDAAVISAALTAANGQMPAVTVSGTERMVVQFMNSNDNNAAGTAPSGWTAGAAATNNNGTDAGFQTFRQDNVSANTNVTASAVAVPAQGAYAFMGISFKPPTATVATLGTQTANMTVGATNQYVGGQFTISTTGGTNITAITVTESGTIDASANLNNIKLYTENDITSPFDCASETLSSPSAPTEAQFGATDTNGFSAANSTSAFTGTVAITPTATQCVYVVLDVGAGAAGGQTIEISINASTDVTSSVANIGGTFPVAIAGTTTIVSTSVSSFNGCEFASCTPVATPLTYAALYTKLAGTAFTLYGVALNTDGTLASTFGGSVTVDLLANTNTGVSLGANNCPTSQTATIALGSTTFSAGRAAIGSITVNTAYRDVRMRFTCSAAVCGSVITQCSSNNFAVRPTAFTGFSSTNANNTGSTGTPLLKTGANFNLTVDSVAGYNGTPSIDNTKVVGSPTAGTIGGSFGAAAVGTGQATGTTFFYSEVGNFGLNLNTIYDSSFTSVDQSGDCTADFSNTLVGGKYGCSFGSPAIALASGFGRFTPDNFSVSLNAPAFGTTCGTFSYVGQAFSYTTAPVMTVTARNGTSNELTNVTTTNYAGSYMKITNTSLTPSGQAARYTRFDALGGGITPTLDTAVLPATTADPTIGTFTSGVGTLTFGSGSGLGFTRSTTTPSAPFNADIALVINVIDSDGVAASNPVNPVSFGAATAGNGIAFGGGKDTRFGRLRLQNAHGSELLNLRIPMTAQYWNGSAFVTNLNDNCTSIAAANIKLQNYQPAGFPVNMPQANVVTGGAFVNGVGSLRLNKPDPAVKGSVDVCVDIGADNSTTCVATTPATRSYLQGAWTGTDYDDDPAARATFGVYKGRDEFIYLRESY